MYEHFLTCPLTDKIQVFRWNNSEILCHKRKKKKERMKERKWEGSLRYKWNVC